MVATGTVAGAASGAVGQITQNLTDGDSSAGIMDGVGTSTAVGAIAGTAGAIFVKAPSVSYRAPSYVTNRPQASSAAIKATAVSMAKTGVEGIRDTLLTEGAKKLIE
jgi:hypothetical protein